MTTTHTPGPWTARKHIANPHDTPPGFRECCQRATYIAGPGGDSDFVADVFLKDDEHAENNARLIAAAPDLLAACKAALPLLSDYRERVIKGRITGDLLSGDYEPTAMLRDAIEKAEAK